jgi:hypothetical protein
MPILIGLPRNRELPSTTLLLLGCRQNIGNSYAILLASFGPEVVGGGRSVTLLRYPGQPFHLFTQTRLSFGLV